MSAAAGCDHSADHAELADELRKYVFGALELVEPYIEQVRESRAAEGEAEPVACASCPVCAVITVLRGGRSELAVRLAEQATGLVAVLRAALAEGVGANSAGFGGGAPGAGPARSGGAGSGGARSGGARSDAAASRGEADGYGGADGARGVQRIPVSRGDAC